MKEHLDTQNENIMKLLTEKSVMKQNVYINTINVFSRFSKLSSEIIDSIDRKISKIDNRVTLEHKTFNQQSFQLKVAGDLLGFEMHTNVFDFDRSHHIFKTGYLKQDINNSFCGIISVYNFLSDSFKYNRLSDLGFLIARIYINKDNHFFIETRTGLNLRYSMFSEKPISDDNIRDIIQELVIYAIHFDLYVPPYDVVKQVTVAEIQEKASSAVLRTGKRLGYIAGSGSDDIFDDANL
ncbi:MAG: hypothetical protein AB7O73_09665 [Bacteroidia bacterium]